MKKKSRKITVMILILCVLLQAGTTLSVQADTGLLSGSGTTYRKASLASKAGRLPGEASTQRKARLEMKARLAFSNRLALNIGALKMEAAEWAKIAKSRIQRLMKNRENLTGDQLAALKDVTAQLKNQHEEISAQSKILHEIRKRLEVLRQEEKYFDAVSMVNELIAAQKTMIELLRESESGVLRITEIQERQ